MASSYSNALFISDLHLSEERPDCNQAFFTFLDWLPRSTDALFILGDFFDYWVGDDLQTDLAKAVALALRQCATQKSINIYFLPGNRDFALGQHYCESANMTLIEEESLFNIADKKIAVSHGDVYCTDDTGYQRYRKIIRNPIILKCLLALPKKTRLKIAQKLRLASKKKFQQSPYFIDVTNSAIENAVARLECDILVHGHTHMASIHFVHEPNAFPQRIVLGDWHTVGWYAQLSEKGEQLNQFDIKEPILSIETITAN